MTQTMGFILITLCVICIILLSAILIKLFSHKNGITDEKIDNLSRNCTDNFNQLRNQNSANTEALRNGLNTSLNQVGEKLSALNTAETDRQLMLVKSLSDMREKLDNTGKEQTKAVTEAVEKLQLSNEKKLEEMRATVDEKLTTTLSSRLDSSFKTVSEQLSNVYKSLGEMKELSGGVNALNRVLTNVKTRGNWAETQLEGILDQIIPNMYVKNYRSDASREVVEFAVIIPDQNGGETTYLPIDSKFPMEDYLRLCEAADNADAETVKAARKALYSRVLSEAKAVSKYINPPHTTPFAVLYLATDSLYAEVISSKENLADRLHNDYSILIAGPSTITALLSSLAMGFRTVALNRKANEVMDLLSAAKTQYEKFGSSLEKAKKKIDEAGKSLDEAQSRNSIIVKKLKNVELIDGDSADNILELPE